MMQEIRIRELSRPGLREWIPPIGAMGGPPAHELYRDLVLYAGLRLLRDREGKPRVALQDGEHRRTFAVPSDELREAIDRFRMRRSLRPVPEQELLEFTRIAEARASDPDIVVPSVDGPMPHPNAMSTAGGADLSERSPVRAGAEDVEAELDSILREIDAVRRGTASRPATAKAPSAWNEVVSTTLPYLPGRPGLDPSISGARMERRSEGGLPRYMEVIRSLVRNGGWLGTTAELSNLTGDDPHTVVASLLGLRSELARQDIVVTSVETKDGWRWLAVDRDHLSGSVEYGSATRSPSE